MEERRIKEVFIDKIVEFEWNVIMWELFWNILLLVLFHRLQAAATEWQLFAEVP